jgi:NAD(P)-dependent dehydrogenase (short-subunit alcohol dehydrogenase family)
VLGANGVLAFLTSSSRWQNAGIARAKPFERFTEEDFDVVYATHVWGSYKIVKAAW